MYTYPSVFDEIPKRKYDIFNILSNIAFVIMFVIMSIGFGIAFYYKDLGALVFMCFMLPAILPMKHPCDYNSYAQWWADRENWIKKKG